MRYDRIVPATAQVSTATVRAQPCRAPSQSSTQRSDVGIFFANLGLVLLAIVYAFVAVCLFHSGDTNTAWVYVVITIVAAVVASLVPKR